MKYTIAVLIDTVSTIKCHLEFTADNINFSNCVTFLDKIIRLDVHKTFQALFP